MSTPRLNIAYDLLAVASLGSSVASWQEQLDWSLRIIATLVAIAAGSVAMWQRLKGRNVDLVTPEE